MSGLDTRNLLSLWIEVIHRIPSSSGYETDDLPNFLCDMTSHNILRQARRYATGFNKYYDCTFTIVLSSPPVHYTAAIKSPNSQLMLPQASIHMHASYPVMSATKVASNLQQLLSSIVVLNFKLVSGSYIRNLTFWVYELKWFTITNSSLLHMHPFQLTIGFFPHQHV